MRHSDSHVHPRLSRRDAQAHAPATHPRWIDRSLVLLRLALGLVFVMHGWQKLTQMGVAGVGGFLASLGIPMPEVSAAVLIAVELGGGLALLAGALTRVSAALIAVSMAVATATVHLANGFFLPGGYEFTLTLGLVAIALVMSGGGRYSVDHLVTSRRHRARSASAQPRRLAA